MLALSIGCISPCHAMKGTDNVSQTPNKKPEGNRVMGYRGFAPAHGISTER